MTDPPRPHGKIDPEIGGVREIEMTAEMIAGEVVIETIAAGEMIPETVTENEEMILLTRGGRTGGIVAETAIPRG